MLIRKIKSARIVAQECEQSESESEKDEDPPVEPEIHVTPMPSEKGKLKMKAGYTPPKTSIVAPFAKLHLAASLRADRALKEVSLSLLDGFPSLRGNPKVQEGGSYWGRVSRREEQRQESAEGGPKA